MKEGAAVTGLVIAGISLMIVSFTGNPIYDPIGSIFVGSFLGVVSICLFLQEHIQIHVVVVYVWAALLFRSLNNCRQ
jgi:uncharacterized protein YacL